MDLKLCPFCHEDIHPQALKCKHCGELLPSRKQQAQEALMTFFKIVVLWLVLTLVCHVLLTKLGYAPRLATQGRMLIAAACMYAGGYFFIQFLYLTFKKGD